MSGAYKLQNKVLGRRFEIDITKEEFEQLRDSRSIFSTVFIIEESLDILMENFFALESKAQAIVIRDMIHSQHSYAHFNTVRADLTRHTINLLATYTTYLSVIKKAKFPNQEMRDATSALISTFRDNDDCHLLEVVRDISQHRNLPISGLSLGASWKSADGSKWRPDRNEAHRSQYTVDFYVNTEQIRSDRKSKFKPENLSSLEKISLPMLVRRSIEAIGLAHLKFRGRIDSSLREAQECTMRAIELYQSHSQNEPSNLHAVSSVGSEPGVLIIDEHFEYISQLKAKNSSFLNLSKRVASTYVDD